jgi:hypothetical protein
LQHEWIKQFDVVLGNCVVGLVPPYVDDVEVIQKHE